jgi:hypothetical protein
LFGHAEVSALELADELVGGGGSHEVMVLVDADGGFEALMEIEHDVGQRFGQIEELGLTFVTRIKHTAYYHDIGSLDVDPGRGCCERS